jgi:ATP adenylyltransferase
MEYQELAEFIDKKMRMSHIYQPVMLQTLLENDGACHQEDIAKKLLSYDISQVEYYEQITNNIVGKVLRSHEIVDRDKATKVYALKDFKTFNNSEISELIDLCNARLKVYLDKHGKQTYKHRLKPSDNIKRHS